MPAVSEDVFVERVCQTCRAVFTTRLLRFPLSGISPLACDVCENCKTDKGKAEGVRLSAQAEAEVAEIEARATEAARAFWPKVCPPLYRATEAGRLPQDALADVLAWQYGPQGLLLMGPTGTGKTRAAFLLLKRLVLEDLRIVRAFDGLGFDHECVRHFRSDGGGEDWADALAKVDVVFLDDLGKGCFTPRVEAELFGLIERRAANCLPTIATTNMTGRDLAGKVSADRGAPMVRRLREFCKCITFSGLATGEPA